MAKRKRDGAGRFFLYLFYGFNALMLWWLFSYWGDIGDQLNTGSQARQTGAAIGATIGTGFIMFIWALGSIITGFLAFLTRGQHIESPPTHFYPSTPEANPSFAEAAAAPASFGSREPMPQSAPRTEFGRARSRPQVQASSNNRRWSWGDIVFWPALVLASLIFLGAIIQIADPEGARARKEASESKQSRNQALAEPPSAQAKRDAVNTSSEPSSFSTALSVDSIRVSALRDSTFAFVTVRVPTKIARLKCAVMQGNKYLGVGYDYSASPPAAEVLVTLPGTDYGSGSRLRAQCAPES